MFSVSLVIALKACEQSRIHSLGDNDAVIRYRVSLFNKTPIISQGETQVKAEVRAIKDQFHAYFQSFCKTWENFENTSEINLQLIALFITQSALVI